jgi:hypothetical protein
MKIMKGQSSQQGSWNTRAYVLQINVIKPQFQQNIQNKLVTMRTYDNLAELNIYLKGQSREM